MCLDVDDCGIEVATDPCEPFLVLLLVGIGDCFEERVVAPRAADILGRAASDRFDQARVCRLPCQCRCKTPQKRRLKIPQVS